jgi:hypothetical protein
MMQGLIPSTGRRVAAALINSMNDAGFDSHHGEEGEGDQQHLQTV